MEFFDAGSEQSRAVEVEGKFLVMRWEDEIAAVLPLESNRNGDAVRRRGLEWFCDSSDASELMTEEANIILY